MKKTWLIAMTIWLCPGTHSQVIKVPVRGKHHTYSHRGLFISKRPGHKAGRPAETGNFSGDTARANSRKKPA